MSFEELRSKFPNYWPIIIETKINCAKKKYLIPLDVNFGTAMISIRKNITCPAKEGLMYMVDNKIISGNTMMRALTKDGFLHIKVMKESVFG